MQAQRLESCNRPAFAPRGWRLVRHASSRLCAPVHICTGTGLARATSAQGPGLPSPHLHRDWASAMRRSEWVVLRSRSDRSAGEPAGPVQQLAHDRGAGAHFHYHRVSPSEAPGWMWAGRAQSGEDLGGVGPVLVQMWQGRTFVTVRHRPLQLAPQAASE